MLCTRPILLLSSLTQQCNDAMLSAGFHSRPYPALGKRATNPTSSFFFVLPTILCIVRFSIRYRLPPIIDAVQTNGFGNLADL